MYFLLSTILCAPAYWLTDRDDGCILQAGPWNRKEVFCATPPTPPPPMASAARLQAGQMRRLITCDLMSGWLTGTAPSGGLSLLVSLHWCLHAVAASSMCPLCRLSLLLSNVRRLDCVRGCVEVSHAFVFAGWQWSSAWIFSTYPEVEPVVWIFCLLQSWHIVG